MDDLDHSEPPAGSSREIVLELIALAAVIGAVAAGGALAIPLTIVGGACLAGSFLSGRSGDGPEAAECYTACPADEPPEATTPAESRSPAQQPRCWAKTVKATLPAGRCR